MMKKTVRLVAKKGVLMRTGKTVFAMMTEANRVDDNAKDGL